MWGWCHIHHGSNATKAVEARPLPSRTLRDVCLCLDIKEWSHLEIWALNPGKRPQRGWGYCRESLPGKCPVEPCGYGFSHDPKSAEPLVCSSRQKQLQACKLSQWGLPCGLPTAKPWGQVYPRVHRKLFPYPSGPSRESIWWKIILRPWDSMFALLGLDLLGTWHPLLSYFSRLGEFALLPVPHSILEAHNFFYFTDSYLESNLSQNQLYLESYAHLIQVIFIWDFKLRFFLVDARWN